MATTDCVYIQSLRYQEFDGKDQRKMQTQTLRLNGLYTVQIHDTEMFTEVRIDQMTNINPSAAENSVKRGKKVQKCPVVHFN